MIKYAQFAYFSRPAADRALFRAVAKDRPRRIVELGISNGGRMDKLIQLAKLYLEDGPLHYTGIDLFESRPTGTPGMSYKQAHKLLAGHDVKGQLIPGDPFMALSRWANSLTDTDLIVISADQCADSLEQAWFYFPRMLHDRSKVFREVACQGKQPTRFELVPLETIRAYEQTRKPRAA